MNLERTPALTKAAIVRRIRADIQLGYSLREACLCSGVAPASFIRWEKSLASGGESALTTKKPTGRPRSIVFDEDQCAIARWHRLCKESIPCAVYFYCLDPAADPELVQKLRAIEDRCLEKGIAPAFPMSVRRAFAVTANEKARFRSKKAVHNTEMVTARGMFYFDEDNHRIPVLPGELWELDDYSCNQPYTYLDPASGELNLGRQILAAIDVASAGWLGFDLIGRERDAYRGEDIVRFISRLLRAHGCPRVLRLERGSWDSSYIHGIDNGSGGKWGALDDLFSIQHTWKSKGKGTIEGSFNPLQRWLSHTSRDIGRYRGEFEAGQKAWQQAKNAKSKPDPRTLGFWEQSACASAHEAAASIMNSRPRTRKNMNERISSNDMRSRDGFHTTPFPTAEAYRLLPIKRRCVVRDGLVTVNPGGGWPVISYVVNGIDGLFLESGYAVFVACDPADPSLGATIANADTSARNRNAYGLGQILLTDAPAAELAPQFNLSGTKQTSLDLRKKASAAAATEFRAIKQGGAGQREVSVTNGHSRHASAGTLPPLERGAAPAQPEPPTRQPLAPTPSLTRQTLAPAASTPRQTTTPDLEALERNVLEHF